MLKLVASIRYAVTGIFLAAAFFLLHAVSHGEPVHDHKPLSQLPRSVGLWTAEEHPIADEILLATGVADYTNRLYQTAGATPVQLYVGYYATQKTGDTIHSPKNCLPGSGWEPVRSGIVQIVSPGRAGVAVNEYVVQQGQRRQLVFYWYQGRGRVIANEYAGKFWMVADAITRNRTDAALVRLVTPINGDETQARSRLTEFAEGIFPQLEQEFPN